MVKRRGKNIVREEEEIIKAARRKHNGGREVKKKVEGITEKIVRQGEKSEKEEGKERVREEGKRWRQMKEKIAS